MIFVQTIRDRYTSSTQQAEGDAGGRGSSENPFIRRPTRGIQIKDDTFATIRVVAAEGAGNRLLVDGGSRRKKDDNTFFVTPDGRRATDIYSNFLLQQISEERMEKQQILETFGEAYIFLFGQRARVISFQGVLANTFDFNWEAEWWHNYEEYLRGTKCVENDARVYISYDDTLVGGYIISTSSSKNSMNKNYVDFGFQLFVTYYSNVSKVGSPFAYQGGVSTRGVTEGVQTVDQVFKAGELAQYRPNLVPDLPSASEGPLFGNGQTETLFSALEANVAKARDAWGKTQQVVTSALDRLSGLLNVDMGVRVPVGFAGSLVFNDSAEVIPPTVSELNGRVRYTTFSDNDDEYVGVGSQYGSSTWSLSNLKPINFGETSLQQEKNYGQEMVRAAQEKWREAGYTVPDVSLGPVSSFLVSKALGLTAFGATAAWQAASNAQKAGSADPAQFASHAAVPVGTPFPTSPIE